jgi:hypothetical protein
VARVDKLEPRVSAAELASYKRPKVNKYDVAEALPQPYRDITFSVYDIGNVDFKNDLTFAMRDAHLHVEEKQVPYNFMVQQYTGVNVVFWRTKTGHEEAAAVLLYNLLLKDGVDVNPPLCLDRRTDPMDRISRHFWMGSSNSGGDARDGVVEVVIGPTAPLLAHPLSPAPAVAGSVCKADTRLP